MSFIYINARVSNPKSGFNLYITRKELHELYLSVARHEMKTGVAVTQSGSFEAWSANLRFVLTPNLRIQDGRYFARAKLDLEGYTLSQQAPAKDGVEQYRAFIKRPADLEGLPAFPLFGITPVKAYVAFEGNDLFLDILLPPAQLLNQPRTRRPAEKSPECKVSCPPGQWCSAPACGYIAPPPAPPPVADQAGPQVTRPAPRPLIEHAKLVFLIDGVTMNFNVPIDEAMALAGSWIKRGYKAT